MIRSQAAVYARARAAVRTLDTKTSAQPRAASAAGGFIDGMISERTRAMRPGEIQ